MTKSFCKISLLALVMTSFFINHQADAVTAIEAQSPDGKRFILVENAVMKLTLDPAQGGRVSSFVWKATSKDWVMPGNAGFFMDHVWQQVWPGELLNRPYEVTILNPGPDRVVVQARIVIEGKGDKAIEGVQLTRTMTFTGDLPRIDVILRLDNPTKEPRSPGLWIQNCINVGNSRDNVWTWRPTARGIISASFDTKLGSPIPAGYKDDFAFDPTAGWSAETYAPTGEGVVFFMDYNYLRSLYDNGGSQSVEWWYDQVRLAPGKSFETQVMLWAFGGMTGVTYANKSLIGNLQMVVKEKNLTLVNHLLAGPDPMEGKATVKLQLIDYDTGQVIQEKEYAGLKISAEKDEQIFPIPNAPLVKNLLARAIVTTENGTKYLYENYRHGPAVIGTEKLYKTARPQRIRPIDRPATIVKTAHQGMKILHLRGLFQNYYRIPEVTKTMGAELKYGSYRIFVYGPSLSYFPSDYPELMSFDAIVINNVPLEAIDDQTQEYLTDYVEHGGVLLVIGGHWAFGGGGYQGSKLEALLPVTTKRLFDIIPVKQGWLSPQLSEKAKIGTLWMQEVQPRKEAHVTIRAGNKPFWIQWKRGQGIVAVMTGVCYGEPPKGMTLFTEWSGWPEWLAGQLKTMIAETSPQ